MQKKLCRPVPLEMIGSLTVATLRELAAEAGSKGGRSTAPAAAASDDAAAEETSAPAEEAPAPQAQAAAAAPETVVTSKKVQTPSPVVAQQKVEAVSARKVEATVEAVGVAKKVLGLSVEMFPRAKCDSAHFMPWCSTADEVAAWVLRREMKNRSNSALSVNVLD